MFDFLENLKKRETKWAKEAQELDQYVQQFKEAFNSWVDVINKSDYVTVKTFMADCGLSIQKQKPTSTVYSHKPVGFEHAINIEVCHAVIKFTHGVNQKKVVKTLNDMTKFDTSSENQT